MSDNCWFSTLYGKEINSFNLGLGDLISGSFSVVSPVSTLLNEFYTLIGSFLALLLDSLMILLLKVLVSSTFIMFIGAGGIMRKLALKAFYGKPVFFVLIGLFICL
jgi:ABC-type long-subunit fatty acid transport system fused permease/ATPase subunit